MASNIGPKIGIDGESEFRKQIKKISTEIATLGTEMKKVSSQFQQTAQSEQALISKNQVLQKSIDAESRKLAEQVKMLEAARDKFGETAEETMRWQQTVNRTETSLNNLKAELSQNEKALQEIKEGFRDAETGAKKMDAAVDAASDGGKLKKLSAAADKVADKFEKISKAAAGLAAAALGTVPATQELRRDMSFLEQNAKQVGAKMGDAEKAFKVFNSTSGETDSAIEGVSNLLQAGFTESNLQKAVEGLAGAATRFPDTLKIEGLADGLQETLATGEAIGPFAELLDRLGIGTEKFNKQLAACNSEAEKQDLVLKTLAKAGLNDSYNAWKKSNQELVDYENAMIDLQQALSTLAATVAPLLIIIVGFATELVEGFNELPLKVQAAAGVFVVLVAAVAPAITAVSKLLGAFSAFGQIGTFLAPKMTALGAAIGGISAPVLIAIAAIGAIVAAVTVLWNTNENFRAAIISIWEGIKEFFAQIADQIGVIFQSFVALINAVWNRWGNDIMAVARAVGTVISTVLSAALKIIETAIKTVTAALNGDWKTAWEGAKTIATTIINAIVTVVTTVFSGLASKIAAFSGSIRTAVVTAFSSALAYIKSLPSKALQWGKDFVQGMINGIKSMAKSLTNKAKELAGGISKYLHFSRPDAGPLRYYEEWMPDFIAGLSKGIYQNIPKLEKASFAAANAIDFAGAMEGIAVSASAKFNADFDYNKLAGLLNQGIYIEDRLIGRAMRERGVIVG